MGDLASELGEMLSSKPPPNIGPCLWCGGEDWFTKYTKDVKLESCRTCNSQRVNGAPIPALYIEPFDSGVMRVAFKHGPDDPALVVTLDRELARVLATAIVELL